jgi:hypothetical protein
MTGRGTPNIHNKIPRPMFDSPHLIEVQPAFVVSPHLAGGSRADACKRLSAAAYSSRQRRSFCEPIPAPSGAYRLHAETSASDAQHV